MGNITVTRFVAAPIEAVFAHLHEPELMRKWMAGFVRAESSESRAIGVGSRSVDVFEEAGRTIEMSTEVTEFDPPHTLAASIEAPQVVMASRYQLETVADGTQVTQSATSMWKMPYRLLGPAMTVATRKRMSGDLERLAAVVAEIA